MYDHQTQFGDFCAALESMDIGVDANAINTADKVAVGTVYGTVTNFLIENNLVDAELAGSIESLAKEVTTLSTDIGLAQLGQEPIVDLCTACGIPANLLVAAVESCALCIRNYSSSDGYDIATHLDSAAPSASHGSFEMRSLNSIFSDGAVENLITQPSAAIEAFGTTITNTITDAKVAVTVSILRYHRSVLQRLIPNIPYDSNVVMFNVDNLEMYDLAKSRDLDSSVRDDGKHRIPFIELYSDPAPANTAPKPILLRTANDEAAPDNVLVAENLIKIGSEVNMFDLSIDPGKIGYQNIDYTDLVGDSVRVKAIYVTATDGTVTEMYRINTDNRSGSRLVMTADNRDSADRSSNMREWAAFDSATNQSDGAATVLLAGLTPDATVKYSFNAAAAINLRTSVASVLGSGTPAIINKSGDPVIATTDATIFAALTFKLVAAELAATFSEENIRKSTKSMRILTKEIGYEIPGSSNVMVQYALNQTKPEVVIDGITKLLSIGSDDRGINLIMDNLTSVYDKLQDEKALSATQNYRSGVGMAYPAGQRVNPSVFLDGTFNIDASVSNLRSGELWGDMRALFDKYLMEISVRLFNESFYRQEIGFEKPVFSVLTSGWVMSALMNIPHYVTALDFKAGEGDSEGGPIEFRRILPNGVHLNVVTTGFRYMTDKILMLPVRPSSPRSVLNFARNAERGVYTASAAISEQSAVYRTMIANVREIPIVTCPIGAMISVRGISNVFDGVANLGI